ncbi:MAG: nuclear transport factor 2 family protein [Planctomycetota bacterium]
MRRYLSSLILMLAVLTPVLAAQQGTVSADKAPSTKRSTQKTFRPEGHRVADVYPLLLILKPTAKKDAFDALDFSTFGQALAAKGQVAVTIPVDGPEMSTPKTRLAFLKSLRLKHRIHASRIHIFATGKAAICALRLTTEAPHEIGQLTFWRAEFGDAAPSVESRWRRGKITVIGTRDDKIQTALKALNALNPLKIRIDLLASKVNASDAKANVAAAFANSISSIQRSPRSDIDDVLDDFHDAAAKGDTERYFAHFAAEAVFLGTDAGERWTKEAFLSFCKPHFKGTSAWIYVPLERNVATAQAGKLVTFDEILGHRKLGICRGSGTLIKREGKWLLLQYNLSFPVPNEIIGGVARQIIAGTGPAPAVNTKTTTVILLRHAEKIIEKGERNPDLSELGKKRAANLTALLATAEINAVLASQFKRTQQTVQPCAQSHRLEVQVVKAQRPDLTVKKIQDEYEGGCVVVAGHSNTVPAIAKALGVKEKIVLSEQDYGDVFIIRVDAAGTTMLRLMLAP